MKKRSTKLERLPGEIRNRIYSYLFDTQRVEINKCMDKTTAITIFSSTDSSLRDPETQNLESLPYKSGKIQTQLSVRFVFTLLSRETLCLLYDCTLFVLASSKCVKIFLDRVPKHAQAVIKHVELRHTMYKEPLDAAPKIEVTERQKLALTVRKDIIVFESFGRGSYGHDGLRCKSKKKEACGKV
ncbi:hypothetical protein BDV11DRAFT_69500 [Aspergillus similis]